jgi:hypothetical protein
MNSKFILVFWAIFAIACKKETFNNSRQRPIPDQTALNTLQLNQIQVLGSHNSYHKRMPAKLFDFLKTINFILPAEYKVESLDYDHEPLYTQLDTYGMRSFEIDIYADPNGGRFKNRKGNAFAGLPEASGIAELAQPGYKVMHIPDIDYETHHYTFKSMLTDLKKWSDAHPNHLPIFLLIEGKETTVGDFLGFIGFATAVRFTPALTDAIDEEIKSVFGNSLDKVITPDKVRGDYTTLEEAVLNNNWPTIGESRGKFIFVMQGASVDDYLVGHPSLKGRAMFTNSTPGKPEAAFVQYNSPVREENSIIDAVQKGYIVRTRSDGPNEENRTGSYANQEAAFRSGGQIISTDYYRPDPRYLTKPAEFTNYSCRFPNGELARINPINAADKQSYGKFAE